MTTNTADPSLQVSSAPARAIVSHLTKLRQADSGDVSLAWSSNATDLDSGDERHQVQCAISVIDEKELDEFVDDVSDAGSGGLSPVSTYVASCGGLVGASVRLCITATARNLAGIAAHTEACVDVIKQPPSWPAARPTLARLDLGSDDGCVGERAGLSG